MTIQPKNPNLFATIYNRRSVRRYKSDPIPEAVLHQVMEAARWSPSGGNGQGYCFGIITDAEKRLALAKAAGDQLWIAEAPVVIACCAKLESPWYGEEFGRRVNVLRWGPELMQWLDTASDPWSAALLMENATPLIPGEHIQLAAAAYGIGTCWIGYLDIKQAGEVLGLPDDWRCYFIMPMGYPDEEKRRPRKPLEEITFSDQWGEKWLPAGQHPDLAQLVDVRENE
ncbi:MAG: nitroreductase family protein [Bacillota bacterium]